MLKRLLLRSSNSTDWPFSSSEQLPNLLFELNSIRYLITIIPLTVKSPTASFMPLWRLNLSASAVYFFDITVFSK